MIHFSEQCNYAQVEKEGGKSLHDNNLLRGVENPKEWLDECSSCQPTRQAAWFMGTHTKSLDWSGNWTNACCRKSDCLASKAHLSLVSHLSVDMCITKPSVDSNLHDCTYTQIRPNLSDYSVLLSDAGLMTSLKPSQAYFCSWKRKCVCMHRYHHTGFLFKHCCFHGIVSSLNVPLYIIT